MSRRDREADPLSVGKILDAFVGRRRWAHRMGLAKIRAAWGDLCGPMLAPRSEATFLDPDGTLSVRCEDGMVATEISMASRMIIDRCNLHLGEERVLSLRVTAGGSRNRPKR